MFQKAFNLFNSFDSCDQCAEKAVLLVTTNTKNKYAYIDSSHKKLCSKCFGRIIISQKYNHIIPTPTCIILMTFLQDTPIFLNMAILQDLYFQELHMIIDWDKELKSLLYKIITSGEFIFIDMYL